MKCTAMGKCGGCPLGNVPYSEQLKNKLEQVRNLLAPFCPAEKIIGMEAPYHYRNKITATFSNTFRRKLTSGRYEEGSRHVVPVSECQIEDERADRIICTITELANAFRFQAYLPETGQGLLRHVQVRTALATGEIMVTIVTGTREFPSKKNYISALKRECPQITTLLLSVNPGRTGMILGAGTEVLYGRGYIEDVLLGKRFRISPQSFYQVNPLQTEKLYATALDFAGLMGREDVLDAYSGIGTIGLCASGSAGRVTGCENNPAAVRDAEINRKLNAVENARFVCADAGDFMVAQAEENRHFDTVFMDPPRAGADERFLNALLVSAPRKIVYVSCNPETLARDLGTLTKGGYCAERSICVDMFPQTEHVETVCLLSKLSGAKNHISVKVEMDEMDLTAAESKATYQEIQDWIQEKYGFHVTHLNIAKTKRKCGIIERQNFNLPKSDDSRSPETQKYKEEAIIEAFRHFQMI